MMLLLNCIIQYTCEYLWGENVILCAHLHESIPFTPNTLLAETCTRNRERRWRWWSRYNVNIVCLDSRSNCSCDERRFIHLPRNSHSPHADCASKGREKIRPLVHILVAVHAAGVSLIWCVRRDRIRCKKTVPLHAGSRRISFEALTLARKRNMVCALRLCNVVGNIFIAESKIVRGGGWCWNKLCCVCSVRSCRAVCVNEVRWVNRTTD